MKNKKQKFWELVLKASGVVGLLILGSYLCVAFTSKVEAMELNRLDKYAYSPVEYKADITAKDYKYNEQIKEVVILAEMNKLAERFNINPVKWEKLLRCEAHDKGVISNLVKNPTSTAVGTGQYLIGTWNETESWKQFRKARTDYKASLWEQALDLSTGEAWRWDECNDIIGIYNYMK